jgi:uncharacterized protein YndB with AHSA1/START domain
VTSQRRLARAGFTLTRDYPTSVDRVWNAFANEDEKRQWFGSGDGYDSGEWKFDFRNGGRDIAEGTFHDGPTSRYVATYVDIVEHVRFVTTYDMWLNGVHMSTSIASFEFETVNHATRFTHVEHGVFFDEFTADAPRREEGSTGLLDKIGAHLSR